MRVAAATIALMRHLRVERGMALLLVIVVAFTAFVMAAIPRLYNRTLDDELQYRAAQAPADWRNITVTRQQRSGLLPEDATILDRMERTSLAFYERLAPVLQEVIAGRSYLVESPKSEVINSRAMPPVDYRRAFQFRMQGGLEEQITLVEGRWPEVKPRLLYSQLLNIPGARGEQPFPYYEVAVSDVTAADLRYGRGRLFSVKLGNGTVKALIRIVGIFTVNDPAADYWNADTRLHEPVVAGFATDFGEVLEVVALPPVDSYEDMSALMGEQTPWHNAWIYYVDPARIRLDNYPELSGAIRELKISLGPSDELREEDDLLLASTGVWLQPLLPGDPAETTILNELPLVLERFAGQARLTSSVIALATLGILGVGLAALGLLAALIADRRRNMVTLLRSRGASRGQLTLARLAEGLLLCLPAALLGYGAAVLAVDARPNPWSLRAALATGLLTALLMVAAAAGNILPRLGELLSGRRARARRLSVRRILVEVVVIVLAGIGIFLLRQRGLEPAVDAEGLGGFDPFLTAVPVLLALAAGIALLRLYSLPVRLLAWLARWLRGTVVFMGLRRMANQSTAANLPLLVLLLAVGVSVFTSIVASSVERAREDLVWTEVRADYRLDVLSGHYPALPELDLTGVPGIERQAREFRTRGAQVSLADDAGGFGHSRDGAPAFTLLAIEANEYAAIVEGTASAVDFPAALLEPGAAADAGSEANPAPAIFPSRWPEDAGERPRLGDVVQLSLVHEQFSAAHRIYVRVAGFRERYPGLNPSLPCVVMRWDALVAALVPQHPRELRATTLYLSGAGVDEEDLVEEINAQAVNEALAGLGRDDFFGIGITSRAERLDVLRDAPLARGLAGSFRLSVALAAIYGGMVVVVALVLTARERARDLGYLRTLGLDARQALQMTLVETVPAVLLACGLGVPLGIAIARLVEPGLDLRAFVGPDVPVGVTVDSTTALLVAAGLALVALLSVAAFSLFVRRVQLGQVLRVE